MAWKKIPKEHHPIFLKAFPVDGRASTIKMFGGIAGMANGHMFSGLWAETVVVRLPEKLQDKALSLKGASRFDPMGRGRPMKDMVLLPASILDSGAELRSWLKKALDFTMTLPPKKRKKKKVAKKKAPKKKAPKKKAPKKKAPKKKAPKKKAPKKKAPKKKAPKKKAPKKKAPKKKAPKKKAPKKKAPKKRAKRAAR